MRGVFKVTLGAVLALAAVANAAPDLANEELMHAGSCGPSLAPVVTTCTTGTHPASATPPMMGVSALGVFLGTITNTAAAVDGSPVAVQTCSGLLVAQFLVEGECSLTGAPPMNEPFVHTCEATAYAPLGLGVDVPPAGFWGCFLSH